MGGIVVENNVDWRNRIVEIRTISTEEIQANPNNWRTHPHAQAEALEGVLNEVGIVDTLKAYHSERYGGLTLMDGELRWSRGGDVAGCHFGYYGCRGGSPPRRI